MFTGTIYVYNNKRKYNIIRPDKWTTGLIDILFEQKGDYVVGEKVQYRYKEVNGKRYAEYIKKINA